MKLLAILFVLCCTWAVVSADASAMRLKARINSQTDAPVTSSESSADSASSMSAESASSMSADAPESANEAALSAASSVPASKLQGPAESSNSQSCGSEPSCKPTIVTCCGNGNGNEGNQDSGINVEDAIGPINQWLKDFKKRSGSSSDLYSAAKTTVQPLIQKIKRNQQVAIDKLEQSNAAILQHIEEAATEHIYNLLKAEKIKDDNHEASEAVKDSESSSYFPESSAQSSSMSQSLSSAAAEKVYSELLKAASHSENSESRSELEKIAKDIVKNGKF